MRNKIGTFALTMLMATMGLAAIAPSAEASAAWACAPVVGLDDDHSPEGEWTAHHHPRFTFPTYSPINCDEVTTEVMQFWGWTFTTSNDDYHYGYTQSGEYHIQVRVLYEALITYFTFHCHGWYYDLCVREHYHPASYWTEVWTEWVKSPTVKIDLDAPDVAIAEIDGPFVQDADADYLTSDTEIILSASDAHSGVDRIEYRIDDGDWQVYNGSARVTGDDGERTFTYRAIDNVGHQTVKSHNFILDNNTSAKEMIRPHANSATYGAYAVETCNGAIRVTEGGQELFAAPDHREAAINATTEAGTMADDVHPQMPEMPDVGNDSPDECTGMDVAGTAPLSVVAPTGELDPALGDIDTARDQLETAAQELEAAVQALSDQLPLDAVPQEEIDAYRDQVAREVEDAREQLPQDDIDAIVSQLPQEEIDTILSELTNETPEAPEAPDQVTVDGQDVDHDPVYMVSGTVEFELVVQDALVGTSNVSFLLDGKVQETQSNGEGGYLFLWDTADVPAGRHEVTLQTVDRLGNQGELTLRTVVISSTAPDAPNPADPPGNESLKVWRQPT